MICNPEYVICICNMIDFGHVWLRIDHDSPCNYVGQLCIQPTAPIYYSKYLFRYAVFFLLLSFMSFSQVQSSRVPKATDGVKVRIKI